MWWPRLVVRLALADLQLYMPARVDEDVLHLLVLGEQLEPMRRRSQMLYGGLVCVFGAVQLADVVVCLRVEAEEERVRSLDVNRRRLDPAA